jgi:phosphatidylethanolamine-binding protein
MFALPVVIALAIPFVAAQSANTAVEVEAIQAHFKQAGIVPSLLATFAPTAAMTINYEGVGDIKPGQALAQEQVGPIPTLKINPANSTVTLNGTFTIAMVDADIVGANEDQVTRHWLVNGVTVSNGEVSNSSATAITSYAGPGPASGSGAHRYVIILLEQPSSFSAPSDLSSPNSPVEKYDFNAYVKNAQLGNIVAANYYTVEVGTSSASVSPTSAVESSTLASVAASGSGTGTSGSTSASATTTGSANNGASALSVGSVTAFLGLAAIAIALV